jgi:hypothetical protein
LLFEFFTAQGAFRRQFSLFEHNACSAKEAEADVAFWAMMIAALNALSAGVTQPG